MSGEGSVGKLTKTACVRDVIVLARAAGATGWPPRAGPHRLDHLATRGRPVDLVLGQRPRDDVVERRRQLGPELRRRRSRVEQVRVHDRDVRLAVERLLSRQALEEQAAEGVDVGLGPDRLALDLLRSGVVERADEEAGPGQPSRSRSLGDPEVGQVHAVGRGVDQHVGGLDVPMNEIVRVRSVECARHLLEDRDGPVELEQTLGDQILEVAAADVPHGDVDDAVLLTRVVDRDDARVVERCDHLRLLDEALAEVAVAAEVVGERLDRGLAAEDRVLGVVDEAHAAAAEQSEHAVAGDLRADAEGFAHARTLRMSFRGWGILEDPPRNRRRGLVGNVPHGSEPQARDAHAGRSPGFAISIS